MAKDSKEELKMDVRNCKSCGKLFNYLSGSFLCPACNRALDEKFATVKEYIYEHVGAGIQEVSDENDVTIPQIQKWIREERLLFSENSMVGIECENCGATIRTGRYCQPCKDKLLDNLGNLYREPQMQLKKKDTADSPRMRFLDN